MSTLNVVTVNFAADPEGERAEVRATVGTANWTWGSGFLRDEPVNLLPVYSGGGVQPGVNIFAGGLVDCSRRLLPFGIEGFSDDNLSPFPGQHAGFDCALSSRASDDWRNFSFQAGHV